MLVRLGLGGRLGTGRQWWSLISLEDEVRALRLLGDDTRAQGPYNLAATAVRMGDVIDALGRAFSRPTLVSVPAPVLRTVVGEMSSALLDSIRVHSTRLPELGFTFHQADLDALVATLRP
jgi:NAD dependent epimerase/dehydratase family enzyme